jgi:hypothetical protein
MSIGQETGALLFGASLNNRGERCLHDPFAVCEKEESSICDNPQSTTPEFYQYPGINFSGVSRINGVIIFSKRPDNPPQE